METSELTWKHHTDPDIVLTTLTPRTQFEQNFKKLKSNSLKTISQRMEKIISELLGHFESMVITQCWKDIERKKCEKTFD